MYPRPLARLHLWPNGEQPDEILRSSSTLGLGPSQCRMLGKLGDAQRIAQHMFVQTSGMSLQLYVRSGVDGSPEAVMARSRVSVSLCTIILIDVGVDDMPWM